VVRKAHLLDYLCDDESAIVSAAAGFAINQDWTLKALRCSAYLAVVIITFVLKKLDLNRAWR